MKRRLLLAALLLPLVAQAPAPVPGPGPGPGPGTAPAPGPAPAPAPAGPSPTDAWVPRENAELILLDKLRGQPTPMTVRAGQSASFGALTIALRSCAVRPPDLPQNAAAFLEITEGPAKKGVFKGWMLANTPAVSQLEDPVYDMRLVTCR